MPALDFKVASTAETWRVQVDDAEVTLVDGKGRLEVKAGDEVILRWWMGGNPGSTISIEVKRGPKVLWSVEKDSIPVGSLKAWGIVTIRVPA